MIHASLRRVLAIASVAVSVAAVSDARGDCPGGPVIAGKVLVELMCPDGPCRTPPSMLARVFSRVAGSDRFIAAERRGDGCFVVSRSAIAILASAICGSVYAEIDVSAHAPEDVVVLTLIEYDSRTAVTAGCSLAGIAPNDPKLRALRDEITSGDPNSRLAFRTVAERIMYLQRQIRELTGDPKCGVGCLQRVPKRLLVGRYADLGTLEAIAILNLHEAKDRSVEVLEDRRHGLRVALDQLDATLHEVAPPPPLSPLDRRRIEALCSGRGDDCVRRLEDGLRRSQHE